MMNREDADLIPSSAMSPDLSIEACPLPQTVSEQIISQFCWFTEGEVKLGMRLNTELYNLVTEFESIHRMKAFDLGRELATAGIRVVISVASPGQVLYRVWIRLQDWSIFSTLRSAQEPLATLAADAIPLTH